MSWDSSERRISRRQPPASAKNERVLCMFFEHLRGEVSHSLYAVEIPSGPFPPLDDNDTHPITNSNQSLELVPTLLFHRGNHDFPFPKGMRCVQLDSNFYFLGGQMEIQPTPTTTTRRDWDDEDEDDEDEDEDADEDEEDDIIHTYDPVKHAEQLFPPKVYILDSATATSIGISKADASKFLTSATSMATGKCQPLVFVASGKIYALSRPSRHPLMRYIEYFEVFDPQTNGWTPLPPPPSNYYHNSHLKTHSIVNNKLYLLLSSDYCRLYSFNLINNEWKESYKLKWPKEVVDRLSLTPNLVDHTHTHTLYGLFEGSLVAFGPVKDTDDGDGEFFNDMEFFSQEHKYSLPLHPLLVIPFYYLIHMGNDRFCHVVTGSPPQEPLPEDWECMPIDPENHYIGFTIFDVLKVSEDGSTFSVAKPLHNAHFAAHTPWNNAHPHPSSPFLLPVSPLFFFLLFSIQSCYI